MTETRREAMERFIAAAGWRGAEVATLAGDASRRRYLRLTSQSDGRAVLMDARPHPETRTAAFLALTGWLRARGYSAPEVLAADPDQGFVLLEDLGDALYVRELEARPEAEPVLYAAAVDLLADLGRHDTPAEIGDGVRVALRPYDVAENAREARLVPEWYLPGATGRPVSDTLAADYDALIATAIAPAAVARTVVLRDYHAENLIWLPARAGHARVGLLDYQDAMAGHPAYDLMSLLEDARRDTSAVLREAMTTRFLEARPDLDREAFLADYVALGAIRNLKILGIFARLARRDGKPRYTGLMPRVWDHLMRDLAHPALAPLGQWVAAHVPPPDPTVRERIATSPGPDTLRRAAS